MTKDTFDFDPNADYLAEAQAETASVGGEISVDPTFAEDTLAAVRASVENATSSEEDAAAIAALESELGISSSKKSMDETSVEVAGDEVGVEGVGSGEITPASRIANVATLGEIVGILNETGGYEDPTAGFVSAEKVNQRIYDLSETFRDLDRLFRRVQAGESDLQPRVDKALQEVTSGENGMITFPPLIQSVIQKQLNKYA